MKINDVRLDFDFYNKSQIEKVKRGLKAISAIENTTTNEESKNEELRCEIYMFFVDVFDEDTTEDIFGTCDPNISECLEAFIDFYQQYESLAQKFEIFSEIVKKKKNKKTIKRK